MMTQEHNSPVALVTGGGKGIGRAIALEMAAAGYDVAVTFHTDEASAQAVCKDVAACGRKGVCLGFDVCDLKQSEAALEHFFTTFGRIDALVNNAGRIADGLFIMMTPSKWQEIIDITLKGFYNITRPVLEKMVRQKSGAVVSIASAAGLMSPAAKAGLIGASRSVAAEVARLGIRVNVVAPGLIQTDMIKDAPVANIKQLIPMARIGAPSEVAKVVRFLCSEDASYITGQVISVNGGMF
jgi:3-oxoacyl-[acyl-carrier protein] reductase